MPTYITRPDGLRVRVTEQAVEDAVSELSAAYPETEASAEFKPWQGPAPSISDRLTSIKESIAPEGWAVFCIESLIDIAVTWSVSLAAGALFGASTLGAIVSLLAIAAWLYARLVGPLRTSVVAPKIRAALDSASEQTSAWKRRLQRAHDIAI